jgi:adenylosuccinate lyase
MMIPRYSRPEATAVFTDENRFRIWFDIEYYAAEKLEALGVIPAGVAAAIKPARDQINPARILEIEETTKHDVIAFLTHIAELSGEKARYVHQGMTSSDVLDTCLSVQLTQMVDLWLMGLDRLLAALKQKALEHKNTLCIGRSHGIHAEPVTFGLKMLTFYAEFSRQKDRLTYARTDIATCAISGAVGTFANISPLVEEYVADKLGLTPEPISTQVIPRDRHAFLVGVMGGIASSLEHLAIEIRHLQRTEVREAEEYFAKGQKGSSAMPHKRNPVLTENLTGLARVIRAAVIPALENVALWHERDISHSSVERTLLPAACIALDFALHRAAGVIEKLQVYPDQMKKNLDSLGGLHASQRILLELTQRGCSREDAYALVQKNAMETWHNGGLFLDRLKADPNITRHIPARDLDTLCDDAHHTRHVDAIFERVLG